VTPRLTDSSGAKQRGRIGSPNVSFPESSSYPEASQATTALVLGILGIVVCCVPLGIFAWVMANSEIRGIQSGRRDPANERTANASRILGIVGTALFVIVIAFGLLSVLLVLPFRADIFQ